jgi:hypothetical protein
MVKDLTAIDSMAGESAAVSSGRGPSTDTTPIAENVWLAQATRLRGKAFRFAQQRIERDLAAAGRSEKDFDPGNVAATINCEPTPTADYLVENEKMADLMRDLARMDLLATPRS